MASVYFKTACMGAGKTALACINAFNYEEQGLTPLCLSSALDTRFGEAEEDSFGLKIGKWESRIEELSRDIFLLPTDTKVLLHVAKISRHYNIKPNVIMVDEAQFLREEQVEELFKIAIYFDIPVLCYGLLTTFKTTLFEGSKRLIELGAKLEPVKSIGTNGKKTVINAKFVNGKIVTEGDDIDIGGDEKYKALSLKDYWDLMLEANND